MRTTVIFAAAATLALAACSSNDDGNAEDSTPVDDESSSISIITTTTIESSAATDAPAAETTTAPDTTAVTETTDSTEPAATTDPATTVVATAPATTAVPATTAPRQPVGNPVVTTELVGQFVGPVDLAVRPGDDRYYVVEQRNGVVRSDGSSNVTVLDLSDRISSGGEQGVLGLAFAPDGTRAYVNFTDRSGTTNIVEYEVGGDGSFDASSERTVLEVPQPFENHNAGDLEFGPDGMLYIPLGDGGAGGDPERNSDDPSTLLGSILRIDPTPSGNAAYTIPPDNPFADGSGGAPEIWSYGLRNPWKIAFDPVTGDLWIPDVGQDRFEEVNVVGPVDGQIAGRGVNFGWSAYEGTERLNQDVDDPGTLTSPVLTYGRGDGCSVTGGVPYRGTAIPELEPAFVYSDFCTGDIWALDLAGGRNLTLVGGFELVTAVRTGPDGEVYLFDGMNGTMFRLIPG